MYKINVGNQCFDFSVVQRSYIKVERDIYIEKKKKKKKTTLLSFILKVQFFFLFFFFYVWGFSGPMQTNNASRAPTECSTIFAFSVLSNGNAQSVFLPDKVAKNINLIT